MNVQSRCLIPVALSHLFEELSDECLECDIPEIADECISYLEQWKFRWHGGEAELGRWKGVRSDG